MSRKRQARTCTLAAIVRDFAEQLSPKDQSKVEAFLKRRDFGEGSSPVPRSQRGGRKAARTHRESTVAVRAPVHSATEPGKR